MTDVLKIYLDDRRHRFDVRYLGRQHFMDELELNYFLSRSLHGIGPSRASGIVTQVKEKYVFEKMVTFNLETMPIDYIRTQER